MIRQRILLAICCLLCSGTFSAQSIDTVHHDNPDFPYSVVEKSAAGTLHGASHTYGRHGELRRTIHYVNGVLHGTETRYHENGQISRTAVFEQGKVHGAMTRYYPGGQVEATMEFRKGMLQGMYTYYFETGQVSMTAQYRNGLIHGTSRLYHRNGNLEWTKGYRKGNPHGERIAWDSTGVPMQGQHTFRIAPYSEATFTVICNKGKPEGEFTVAYPDGKVLFKGRYVLGLPDGEWIYYESTGLVDRVDVYRKGRFKETRRSFN
jgi:antitoxin component YwqK of YwqJK toxin-antitoxin module